MRRRTRSRTPWMRRGAKGGGAKDEREGGRNDEEERRGNEGYKRASYIVETLYAGNGHPFVDIEGGKNCRCTRVRCRYNQFTDFHRKNDVEKRHKTQGQSRGPCGNGYTRDQHCPIRHNVSKICHKGSPLFRPLIRALSSSERTRRSVMSPDIRGHIAYV